MAFLVFKHRGVEKSCAMNDAQNVNRFTRDPKYGAVVAVD